MTNSQKLFMSGMQACELCGSKRNLQLHHLIPMVCANGYCDIDVEDNWLCVCSVCHAKLTPKNLLTKYGLGKVKMKNYYNDRTIMFYDRLNQYAGDLDVIDVLDVFDDVFCVNAQTIG